MHLPRTVAAALVVVLALPAVSAGHHSFFAQFDPEQPVTLSGTVSRLEWRNPHIWVFLDVTGEDGTVTTWQCEGGAPNALTRRGWNRSTLAIGGELTIFGYKHRAEDAVCNTREWTYEGRTVFAGSADDGGPSDQPTP
jgi:hypothetical protein